jgi:hypothetical protein
MERQEEQIIPYIICHVKYMLMVKPMFQSTSNHASSSKTEMETVCTENAAVLKEIDYRHECTKTYLLKSSGINNNNTSNWIICTVSMIQNSLLYVVEDRLLSWSSLWYFVQILSHFTHVLVTAGV